MLDEEENYFVCSNVTKKLSMFRIESVHVNAKGQHVRLFRNISECQRVTVLLNHSELSSSPLIGCENWTHKDLRCRHHLAFWPKSDSEVASKSPPIQTFNTEARLYFPAIVFH